MSLFEDIRDLSGGKSQKKSWWRSNFQYALQAGTPQVGKMIFFRYNATYGERMQFWDRYPLVYVLGEDGNRFWGANLHYLPPAGRTGLGETLKTGVLDVPPVTYHKYLRSNVLSPTFDVPISEWSDVGLIPCEQFVSTVNGRNIDVPSQIVYRFA